MTVSAATLAQEIVGNMAAGRRPLVGRLAIAHRGLRGINPNDLPIDLQERLAALLIAGDPGVSGDVRATLEAIGRSQLGPLAGQTVRLLLAIMKRADTPGPGLFILPSLSQAEQAALAAGLRDRNAFEHHARLRDRDGASPG